MLDLLDLLVDVTYGISSDVEETGSPSSTIEVASTDKIFLSMTCDLCRCTRLDKVP